MSLLRNRENGPARKVVELEPEAVKCMEAGRDLGRTAVTSPALCFPSSPGTAPPRFFVLALSRFPVSGKYSSFPDAGKLPFALFYLLLPPTASQEVRVV